MTFQRVLSSAVFAALALFLTNSVSAVSPTEEAIAKWKAEGTYETKIANWKEFKALGGCAPVENRLFDKKKMSDRFASGELAVDTVSILVILVDFPDHFYNGMTHNQTVAALPYHFDSILFSDKNIGPAINPTGSMTDFYMENSYGNFYVIGGITNWLRMPQNYDYYEAGTDGIGSGIVYSQLLVREALYAADTVDNIDFTQFDYDNDNILDGLVIIHAGRGAETGAFGIWSHAFHTSSTLMFDGVNCYDYTMNPEEDPTGISPIGVICHEFGHFLGLPDLYDIDYDPPSSDGLGRWSLMASGNYNGSGRRPAHMDAWCKDQVGFLNLISVTSNMDSVEIPAVEFSPVAYRLSNINSNPEYWVVENRQKLGSDLNLPGDGLLIYHVDPAVGGSNNDPLRYHVALEQADGKLDLEFTTGNTGDNGDPYPGSSNNREFHDYSDPSNIVNWSAVEPNIGVWEISDSDSLMYADLDFGWSRPFIVNDSLRFSDALGNNDGYLDQGETIRFYFTVRNLMRTGFNATATLSTSNPDISFTANNVMFDANFDNFPANNNSLPITFDIDINATTIVDSFYLTITCDSVSGTPGNGQNYSKTFGFEVGVGTPQILVVDDDRGDPYQDSISQALSRTKKVSDVWEIDTQGIPTINDLMNFPIVIWSTGDSAANVITAPRISVMKQYLDMGNNLMLATMSGIADMHSLDSAFMNNYFKATRHTSGISGTDLRGIDGSEIGNGTRYVCPATVPFNHARQAMNLVSGGEAFFSYLFAQTVPFSGISYRGSYKTVLICAPIENIRESSNRPPLDTLLNRVIKFFEDVPTDITEPSGILPLSFQLEQNYPNPFNPTTNISYTIHTRGKNPQSPNRTTLVIYNLLGQKIKTLVDKVQSPGTYEAVWYGDNDAGDKVSSGVYFYRLILGEESQTRKMILMK